MKVLAIHTGNNPDEAIHAVDLWRVARPFRELGKNVEWEITERPTIMKHFEKYKDAKDFTEEELEATVEDLKQYDIIFGSYTAFMHGMVYALCKLVEQKYGVKIVIDVDDDLFSIKEDNIGWWKAMSHEKTWELQTIIRANHFVTTTNEYLANKLRERGVEHVYVLPNYITKDYKAKPPKNEDVVIGYFGGASHFQDLNETPAMDAIEKLMHKYKNVRFVSVGMAMLKYLPKQRFEQREGKRGKVFITDVFPKMQFDISIAPLTLSVFNNSKSDIKWQESSMMHAAFVGTKARPYLDTVKNGEDGILVKNTIDEWYEALEKLVLDETERKRLATNAYNRVTKDFLIENHWQEYKEALEEICKLSIPERVKSSANEKMQKPKLSLDSSSPTAQPSGHLLLP